MSDALIVTPYLNLPYADHGREGGYDCWGAVRLVLQQLCGLALPDYGDHYVSAIDRASVAGAIRHGLTDGWRRVDAAVVGALVIFNIRGKPWHVGLVVGPDDFFHMPANETSCIERLSSPGWAPRIEGFYVHD